MYTTKYNIIFVTQIYKNKAFLIYNDLITNCYIGKNGITSNKIEGDKKTPSGIFNLGICFGFHSPTNIKINNSLNYLSLNKNHYWIDDINSIYYNRLVDITEVKKDWFSAEHLIDYPIEYEYAIEIKANPKNIPNKGSAIFLHCSNNTPTSGCLSIPREKIIQLLSLIDNNTKILIK